MTAEDSGTAESFVETAPLTDVFGTDPWTRVIVETDDVDGTTTYRLADGEAADALRRLNSALLAG